MDREINTLPLKAEIGQRQAVSQTPEPKPIYCINPFHENLKLISDGKLKIKNLCDHKVYLNISTKYPGIFGFDDEEDIIDPHDYQLYCFDEDDDKSIVISKDKPMCGELNSVYLRYEDITNILYEGTLSEINDTIVIKSDDESQWKTATLKLNFLMKELKRLGADKHETYSCIIDLHQDIVIPHDKE